LLYALDDSAWGMKITALEESADFATLLSVSQLCDADLSVLFHKFDSHVLDSSGKRVCCISRIGNVF
jgi:hypothetical protein